MTDIIAHRGPDSEGVWVDGNVGLGHRRLSIIDLSEQAAQPMISEDRSAVITFNGEIYNYRELARSLESKGVIFSTRSDTEVILKLYATYGHGCVDHLRGMFAFAIWDRGKKELFLARDRVGIKPLYYLNAGGKFVFGSEIKAVLASGQSSRKLNRHAFFQYMRFLVVPQPDTIFEDVLKLEPGAYMIVDSRGGIRKSTYYSVNVSAGVRSPLTEQVYVERLDHLLRESVGYHMVADVPIGAFLSGGLDSSGVVAMMRRNAPNQAIKTFSIEFPQFPDFDEGRYARTVAADQGTDHTAGQFRESFLDDLDSIAWHLDEPFAVSSAFASFYLARSAAEKTKVVLTGDGGDELFAGYEGYKNERYRSPSTLVRKLLSVMYHVLLFAETLVRSRKTGIYRSLVRLGTRIGSEGVRYSQQVAQSGLYPMMLALDRGLFLESLRDWPTNLMARYYDASGSVDELGRKLYCEYKTRLVDEMLMKVDRMTMAHSLEARVPLLDHNVVDYAFALPAALKLHPTERGLEGKYALKRVMENYLPREIVYRNKQGFNIPIRPWLQGAFLEQVRERVSDGYLVKNRILDSAGVARIFANVGDQHVNYTGMLMLLLAFETWASVYSAKFGAIAP
jgi:asparagine synthase (glutamine-hydrolysing)